MPKTSIEFVVATLIVFTGGIVAGVNLMAGAFSEQAYAPTTFMAGAAASGFADDPRFAAPFPQKTINEELRDIARDVETIDAPVTVELE